MTAARGRILLLLVGLCLTVTACERPKPPPPPATAPATQAATKPATKPKDLNYVDVIRAAYPKLPATQPLGVPVDLNDAGKFILDAHVYVCPRGDLWITHKDAPAISDVLLWRAGEDQIHLLREPVVFAFWATDQDGKWFPRPVVRNSGGAFEWIDCDGRKPTTAGRAYRWDDATLLGNGDVAVPSERGISIFAFTPQFKEDYHELVKEPGGNPPTLVLDATGFLAWAPWDNGKPGSHGVTRYADGKWAEIPVSDQWPEKILHLVPLLDGTVLQLVRPELDAPVKLTMSVMETVAVDEKVITDLVDKLSDNDPEVREQAYAELTRYGNSLWPILEKTLEDQPPEARIRMQELLRNRIAPTLGGREPVDGAMSVVDRFEDGGVALYLPAGVRVPDPYDATKPKRVVKPAWISIRPGRAIELLDKVLVREFPPGKQHLYAFGDEWVVSDDAQGPQRLYGNHLEPMLSGKEETAFRHVIGVDRRGRWLFKKPGDDTKTLLLDPTLPDPTPKLPVWLLPVAKGMVGWTKADWPAVKGSANLVRNLDIWSLHEGGWQPVDPKVDQLITVLPKVAPPTTATTQPYGPPIGTDKDGAAYYEGKELLVIVDKSGKETKWPLPANAVGKAKKCWIVRADDGRLFLFNQPGRCVRIKPTPEASEPFTVEAVFTNRIPNTDKIQRIWLDPAGRLVIMFETNKLAICFPTGRIPKDIALMIPAKELQ